MKIVKRIFYIIFGFLLASAISLVGVILYAEYSGRQLWAKSGQETADDSFPAEESRLAYDENGNLAELPGSSQSAASESESASDTGNTAETSKTNIADTSSAGMDVSNTGTEEELSPADSGQETASPEEPYTGSQIEQLYIMDMGSALFHTANCPYAANIAIDKRAERTTTSEKILNAGYQPCPNCNP